MLVNIFFALVAIGAMCIDIVLNRGLLDEINDEAKEQGEELRKFLSQRNIPETVKERIRSIIDTVDTLTEKVKIAVQKGCASKNARPFYVAIIIASSAIVFSAVIDYFYEICSFNGWGWFPKSWYLPLCIGLNIVWVLIFGYLFNKLRLIYNFNKKVESERNTIRKIVQDTKYSIISFFQ